MPPETPTLYSPSLLALARSPQHSGPIDGATHTVRVDNPLCGDRVTLHLRIRDRHIEAIGHQTRGCALCVASASAMTSAVLGQPLDASHARAQSIVQGLQPSADASLRLDDPALTLFRGLHAAPGRHGCVALPWQALIEGAERAQNA